VAYCLISGRLTNENVAEPSLFLEVFQQVIIDLQQSFKSGVASLITCFISYESDNVWGYTVGDSRIGTVGDEIVWLSPVHTGANPLGESFTDSMKLIPERHILTRCLNMRKKCNPEFFQINVAKEQSLVIASDGFWAELTSELQLISLTKQQVQAEDDSSFIVIKDFIGAANLNCTAFSENCNYFDLTNKG
jgi:serine/threonine protein phosphatase PrpC